MKSILVVDDSPVVREQVGLALRAAGYVVFEAIDGLDGAQKIAATPGVAGVICDFNMPRMNALEMLEEVVPLRPDLPILMLTTEGQPALIQRAKQAGARGWIIKPFRADMLVATMRKVAA